MTEPVNGREPGWASRSRSTRPEDLGVDADRAEALITVTGAAPDGTASARSAKIAEILIMDRSLSMLGQR